MDGQEELYKEVRNLTEGQADLRKEVREVRRDVPITSPILSGVYSKGGSQS
ncbi:hypothetical protein [Gracilibacillus alcaliphilus]|uniref:hypothetical protein n=1 Tax=Gracilibacillus alcaliphilus TaxID=1401441 RepID=UPI0019561679|nr:hypothetical protein [Gracilibacillus alcaliphilus]MBM7675077.1 hypothetical protein [Gracilibacillus alcaliphilus]